MRAVGLAVRGRPSPNPTQPPPGRRIRWVWTRCPHHQGPPPPWGRCYLDGAALPLPYQVDEVGVSPGEPGFSTVGWGSHMGSIWGTTKYESPLTGHHVCAGWSIGIVRGFHCHEGSCGPVGLILLSVLSGLDPMDACPRRIWQVAHPVRLVLGEGSKGPFLEGACDP